MLIKMSQEAFNTLNDEALGTACVDPIIKAYKEIQTRGEDFTTVLYQELSRGQQALFVFRAYYNHVLKSDANFYWWSAYFMAHTERWSGLKNSLRFFGDRATLPVLECMEGILKSRDHPKSLEHFDVSANDLHQDPELMSSISPLYENLQKAVLTTHELIGSFIRTNTDDFVQIVMD